MTVLPCIEIETAPNPSAAVIWLHGLGADGNDFVPIIPQLNLSECPAIRFVFPSAPSMAVTVNGGYVMPAWYDITERDINAREDLAGIHKSAAAISQLIEREASRGIAYEKIILAGFSQGCAMSLQVGLRFPHRLAGIMALSGYLPLANSLALERSEANGKTPILMAHGVWDAVITLERAEASADILEKLGYQVDWNTYPMEHSLHPDELVDISRFLSAVLSKS
ncbi:putative esterase [Polynucleobacter duraquae]|uniref:Esterase n=1 Tax=Polynucleobacter duraquae TaxID=1835254 RepID=A0A0E3ZL30_9BURK|nr:carboxylesterase [Polynucleobacter duraquae]AKD24961.1 putative esterase [Polynucleobacter duraquae]